VGFATGHPAVCYRIPIDTELPSATGPAAREPVVPIEITATTL
jgi:hypothetical protein